MAKKEIAVKPVKIVYVCDDCGKGEMHFRAEVKVGRPYVCEHVCDNCGKVTTLDSNYPRIEYR